MPSPRYHWDAIDTMAYATWVDQHPELENEIGGEPEPEPPKYQVGRANFEVPLTPQREAQLIAEVARLGLANARLEYEQGELAGELERTRKRMCWWCRMWERIMGRTGSE
jgi:hypothetical protein